MGTLWQKTTSDPVALYTGVLAAFTAVLVIVSVVQIRFLTRADKTARISADAAREAALASREQANIAAKQMVSAFPPKLHVRHMQLGRAFDWTDIAYTISNDGQADASLIGGRIVLLNRDAKNTIPYRPLESSKAYDLPINRLDIPPGGRVETAWHADGRLDPRSEPYSRIVVVGYIDYEDLVGVKRRTGFARAYEETTHRFLPLGGDEYEYE